MRIEELVKCQRAYFETGATRSFSARMEALERLKQGIRKHEKEILEALRKDLGKSPFESYMAEIGMTLSEISYIQKHLAVWMRARRRPTPLSQFPASSLELAEPYGNVLIMAPWNYPFLLCMEPLAGALAAGNCCVLKPAHYAAATSEAVRKIVQEAFEPGHAAVVEGGRAENAALLEQKFDYIFFTGSRRVGQLVLEKAAANLTPVSLELGGKSPCIVDQTADLRLAAKRIVFGKYLNAGQTCVAPDYLLVQESVRDRLIFWMRRYIKKMYGENPLENKDYPRIINEAHFLRLKGLMEGQDVCAGGQSDRETLKIAPTLLSHVAIKDPVMEEEIFGPLLPVLTFRTMEEAIRMQKQVLGGAKPLALYLFTKRKDREKKVLSEISFGGGCVNDTIVHLATPYLGFGGVGDSGMGSYHGKRSFETFSHRKSILKKSVLLDLPVRYPPAGKWKAKLLRVFLK